MKAFPTAIDNGHSENQDGMDLRDYFAAKIMAASFYNPCDMTIGEMKDVAEAAYLMADTMMKVRKTKWEIKNMVSKSSEFIWTGASTDITIRWKLLYGWIPPSESPEIQKKWAEVRTLSIKGIESLKDPEKIKVKESI